MLLQIRVHDLFAADERLQVAQQIEALFVGDRRIRVVRIGARVERQVQARVLVRAAVAVCVSA